MKRWSVVLATLTMIFVLSGFGFKNATVAVPSLLRTNGPTAVLFPKDNNATMKSQIKPPYVGKHFIGFKEALAFKESRGDYSTINEFGYLGKYQFGTETLSLMGVSDSIGFVREPVLQERIFKINVARNKWLLRKDIDRYVGKDFGGTQITESGIIAAAHLAGAGNVKRFLRSYGEVDVTDGFGTTISKYIELFAGYDISMVHAKKNPRL